MGFFYFISVNVIVVILKIEIKNSFQGGIMGQTGIMGEKRPEYSRIFSLK
jgi:hypothetical protein